MNEQDNFSLPIQHPLGAILWLTGWSMPDQVFEQIRELLPEFYHCSIDYSDADTPEKLVQLTETAARECMHVPLLIGGWSLGGLLALKLAAEGLADGLVLLGATARFTRSKDELDLGWRDMYVRQMITGLTKDRQAVETNFRKLIFTESEWQAGMGLNLPPIGSWTTPALISGLQLLRTEECLSQLATINCPVLLIHGTEDRICPYGAATELAAQLPHATLISMPDCGHAPFLGKEDHIANELRRWWHEQKNKRDRTSI